MDKLSETTKGLAFLLKAGDGDEPQTYRTMAGLRVENDQARPDSYSVTASGIFVGSMAEVSIRNRALSGEVGDYELSFETGERMRGKFLVTRFDYAGDFNGERTYRLGMESSGSVTVL